MRSGKGWLILGAVTVGAWILFLALANRKLGQALEQGPYNT